MWGVEGVGPPVPAHISLTVFIRFALCTGGYAVVLVALLLTGSFMIQLIMCAAMRDLPIAVRTPLCTDDVGYAKVLNPF